MGLQIKGLSHITFICKDLEKTARIFKDIFGAEEVYSSGDKTFSISREKFLQKQEKRKKGKRNIVDINISI